MESPSSPSTPSSLKQKLKSTLCSLHIPPFRKHNHHHSAFERQESTQAMMGGNKEHKCKGNMLSCICRRGRGHHRRHSYSDDFRYDPLSYSLNFDEGGDELQRGLCLRRFSSRLPPSQTTMRN